tara:strand:- start:92 stop:412 length:321 start_codon:yes stop_codon:yes gene_type:complete
MAYNGSYNNGDALRDFFEKRESNSPQSFDSLTLLNKVLKEQKNMKQKNIKPALHDAMARYNPQGDSVDKDGNIIMKKEDMTKEKMLEDWIKKEKTGTNPSISQRLK